jgi:hypothetical protein
MVDRGWWMVFVHRSSFVVRAVMDSGVPRADSPVCECEW